MQEQTGVLAKGATPDIPCEKFSEEGGWVSSSISVPSEMEFKIYVNSLELVTIQCTPVKLNCLVLGFLYSQGI
jgi:formate dehydrogenase assembly factor FdhD